MSAEPVRFEQTFVIRNELGLHARAATRFVQVASRYSAEVEVERAGRRVNGKSIMGVLMLVATKGAEIKVCGTGDDAVAAVSALGELIGNKFGED